MTERPILFSAPMVRALLAGTKTQTRRAAKFVAIDAGLNFDFTGLRAAQDRPGLWTLQSRDGATNLNDRTKPLRCPYGVPGDRLWVREKLHRHAGDRGGWLYAADNAHVTVKATDDDAVLAMRAWAHHVERDYCVSIHMPRWASRITLEVTEVRVQRLQDISEEDAIAEGCNPAQQLLGDDDLAVAHAMRHLEQRAGRLRVDYPIARYIVLWESINGPGSWARNDWVWATSFPRLVP